jgi:hypothetical protein
MEPHSAFREEAVQNLKGLPAKVLPGDSRGVPIPAPEFVFLDSGPHTRQAEIDFWLDSATWMSSVTTLAVHDANREYGLPERGLRLRRGAVSGSGSRRQQGSVTHTHAGRARDAVPEGSQIRTLP